MVLGRDLIAAPAVVTVRFEYSPVMALTNGFCIAHAEEAVLESCSPRIHPKSPR
jgi:hypothetical protein